MYFPQFAAVVGVGCESYSARTFSRPTVHTPEEKINVEYSCGVFLAFIVTVRTMLHVAVMVVEVTLF